jgi:hypothetical protein
MGHEASRPITFDTALVIAIGETIDAFVDGFILGRS